MRDVSSGGAGLLLGSVMTPGEMILLHLPRIDERPVTVRCRVVHCTPTETFFRVGVEFLDRPWDRSKQVAQVDDVALLEAHLKRLSNAVLE